MLLADVLALAPLTTALVNPLQSFLSLQDDTCPPDYPCSQRNPIDNIFCEGKMDGDYPHPYSCTYFIACVAGTEAYEMPCALDRDGCRLFYVQSSGPDQKTSRCDYRKNSGCSIDDIKCPDKSPIPDNEADQLSRSNAGQNDDKSPLAECEPASPCTPDGQIPSLPSDFCAGRGDGNYPHPYSCSHYIACVAEEHAYEMVCADNLDGCPLHYVPNSGPDPATSRCDYPEVAGCEISTCPSNDSAAGENGSDPSVDDLVGAGDL